MPASRSPRSLTALTSAVAWVLGIQKNRGRSPGACVVVFVFGADKRITREIVADIRGRAAANGRDPRDILIFYNRAAVVGRTRREAEEKYREYHKHASVEGALAHFSSSTGLDFSRYEQDEPIR